MIARRIATQNRLPVSKSATTHFTVDGQEVSARTDETVLTALRMALGYVRIFEFCDEPRAGFCMMGACQDCWLWRSNGERVRACTTLVEEGMQLSTVLGMAQ